MNNSFFRVINDTDFIDFTSKGMNVYINLANTNLNIFGNHVMSGEKFAVSEINSNLERYLRKGFAKLVANAIYAAENTVETPETTEATKQKKKKTTESEAISQENTEAEEIPAATETPQPQEQEATEEQTTAEETPETSKNI
jgi:cobalamin biosynthesis Mg chelatase CobN